ncbi:MAG: hypothetical protein LBU12_06695 [Deltaproteobacteria bacterium]|jgi:Fe-S cluster assembly iron-binding protein IscA|nr:hypothetical protein [Deltaproteobacteria bacterium]
MIHITSAAQERLGAFLTDNKADRNVRIFLPTAGCGGQGQLSLTVDEPNDADFSVPLGDIVFCISKSLQAVTGAVTIDFKNAGPDSGFVVEPEKILPAFDSECGGDCCGCN